MNRDQVLETIFNPSAVAVVGATENPSKMGNWCVRSLMDIGFPGRVYPINPNRTDIMGIKAYGSVRDVPERIDLAVIVVPSHLVPSALVDSAEKGAKGAVIITSGFREVEDPRGQALQRELSYIARTKGIRVIGPNTFGMVHTHARLNTSFTPPLCLLKRGSISLVGQSGGVSHLSMFTAIQEGVGLNKVIGLGNRCDLDFPELLNYLRGDPGTRVIALYIEGLEEAAPLLGKAREVVSSKPIVVLKGGRSEAIRKASIAHTGAMAGSYEVYRAGFRQAGMVTVSDPVELLDVAKGLALLGPLRGDRVAVMSIQAGPGILMTDMSLEQGLALASFERQTLARLEALSRNMTIITNPVDLGFAITPPLFQEAVEAVLLDPNVDALLINAIDPSDVFRHYLSDRLLGLAREKGKPMVVSYIPAKVEEARPVQEALEGDAVVFYPKPDRAVRALAGMVRYGRIKMELSAQAEPIS
ncbi:MAG: acetate--CoA ligase family protein [Thermodesulfobacteriota bacterium]